MSYTIVEFSSVHIIESLPPHDRRTGENLFRNVILPYSKVRDGLRVRFHAVHSVEELHMTLYGIIQEAQEGLRPILHIEAHGDETGFETSSGEVVTWLELRQWLEAINVASDLNLIVSLGACKGAWLLSVSGPPGRAPFACLFAPVETIGDRDVERAFSIFFEEVFHSLNFGNAIHRVSLALPKTPFNTALYSARQVFLRGYEAFSSTHFSIERLSARAQQFEHQIRRSTSDPRRYWLSFDLREHYLRTIERIHHETCRRMKEEYFACDLDRRNHLKFGLDEFPH